MNDSEPQLERKLTEFVLGLLDEAERAEVQARLDKDPALSRKTIRIISLLRPLDAWNAPEPRAGLTGRILKRAEATTPLEYVAATTSVGPISDGGFGHRSRYTLGQLVAMAACIALIFAGLFPAFFGLRGKRLEATCGSQMAGLGRGIQMYAAANNGALPAVAIAPGANWMQQPNRRHLLPAIRLQFIVPASLVCPTTPLFEAGAPPSEAGLSNDAFINAMLSNPATQLRFYSPQNMQGPVVRITGSVSMPIASDPNPVFDGGSFRPQVGWTTNSPAHNGRGQNVLFDDGSSRFLKSPVFGAHADNIWRAEDVDKYSGTEAQASATDAFLTP